MAVEIINGCLLDAFDAKDVDCIAHVCNAQGVMGSGIAKSIKDRYPKAFDEYSKSHIMGRLSYSYENVPKPFRCIFNLVSQDNYGRDRRHLNYGALAECLLRMRDLMSNDEIIGFPYLMGCDRAGGDWEIVLEMIEFIFRDFEVKIYKLH